MKFTEWLATQPATDADIIEVKALIGEAGNAWPAQSDELPQFMVLASRHPGANGEKRLESLGRVFQKWSAETKEPPKGLQETILSLLAENFGLVVLAIAGAIIAIVLINGVSDHVFLDSIGKPDQARGLITFLFAFSTIAIIILVAIATFWMEKDEVEERFRSAKDLITILIGVLGTILGFYFGSADSDVANRGLLIANVSSPTIVAGQTGVLSGLISGGAAPYRLDFKFNDSSLDKTENKATDGVFAQTVAIKASSTATEVTYEIIVRDAKGVTVSTNGTIPVKK